MQRAYLGLASALICGVMYQTKRMIDTYYNSLGYLKRKYEKDNNCKLVVLIQTTAEEINKNTSDGFVNAFNEFDDEQRVDVILHTTGGYVSDSKVICDVICSHKGEVNINVPMRSQSGGSEIALCGKKLFLGKHAYLSPFDPLVNTKSGNIQTEILKNLKDTDKNMVYKQHSLKADNVQKFVFEKYIKHKYTEEVANKIYDEFVSGKHSHPRPFSRTELLEIGVKIDGECSNEIKQIFNHSSK
jgi:ClpP class serine protease